MSNLALSLDAIRRTAPSVFTSHAHEAMSARYVYIPTSEVLEGLMDEGWHPVKVQEQRTRTERSGFQKHMIRLRRENELDRRAVVGDSVQELVLRNAHDGTSSYTLDLGVFRFVCTNGMVVSNGTARTVRVPHARDAVHRVIEGTYEVLKDADSVSEQIEHWQNLRLDRPRELAFARSAMALRWEDIEDCGFIPEQIIRPRRYGDTDSTLWGAFNRVQENLMKGGFRGYRSTLNGTRATVHAREIRGIDQSVRLNKALWSLTTEMAETLT